jgi:hypothetical protein
MMLRQLYDKAAEQKVSREDTVLPSHNRPIQQSQEDKPARIYVSPSRFLVMKLFKASQAVPTLTF